MRHITLIAAIAATLTLAVAAPPAKAQRGGPFGIGVVIGEPTGIGGRLYLGRLIAVNGAVAWSLDGNNELHLQGDYVFHNYNLFPVSQGELPLYFGVGGRIKFVEEGDDLVGVRFPVGVNYIFAASPFDIFAEIVPILELAPDTDVDFEGAIGARFYF